MVERRFCTPEVRSSILLGSTFDKLSILLYTEFVLFLLEYIMIYRIQAWQEGGTWCAETPDKDRFRHPELTHAVGEIFKRVNAAAQKVPSSLMNESVKEIGTFMVENGANYGVSITYPDFEKRLLDSKTNPSHPMNLCQSLMTGTR